MHLKKMLLVTKTCEQFMWCGVCSCVVCVCVRVCVLQQVMQVYCMGLLRLTSKVGVQCQQTVHLAFALLFGDTEHQL